MVKAISKMTVFQPAAAVIGKCGEGSNPEFTRRCLELFVAPARGAPWLQACPTSGPEEPSEKT